MTIYDIDNNKINNIPFEQHYKSIVTANETGQHILVNPEFYGKIGEQHYRLLAYLSTLFSNSVILDIGSHLGYSALSLSFQSTNIIHSFDNVDNVLAPIKTRPNINFHIADLFDPVGREAWKNLILSAAFIFLDMDPHNGTMEIELYRYLKEIGYTGFVVCDDIWYFKDMRDHFWYHIPLEEKYDLSIFGHWSGTGVFTPLRVLNAQSASPHPLLVQNTPEGGVLNERRCNKQRERCTFNTSSSLTHLFPKNDISNWTLVTGYFNLTKCPDASKEIKERDVNYYFSHSISTLMLPYNLVIYCDEESLDKIQKIRPYWLTHKTQYYIYNFDTLTFIIPEKGVFGGSKCDKSEKEYKQKDNGRTFAEYRQIIQENRIKFPYHFDNRNTASYYLFCMSRYALMKRTIEDNPFGSTHFSWINFCIERMGFKNLVHLEEGLAVNRDKFSTCYIDYIPETMVNNTAEYFKWGRCSMCSGFFTGNAEYMYKVCDLIEDKFLHYLKLGYGHADEQLYSPVYFENPELFEHYYGDYQQMVTNYKYIYDAPEPPIYNFIKNSVKHGNGTKCFEACKFVLNSLFLKKCVLNKEYLDYLFYYLMECKQILYSR